MLKFLLIITLILNCFSKFVVAQEIVTESVSATMLSVNYSLEIPMADMADRFGINSTLGFGMGYRLKKNWLFGAEGYFLFGNTVKDTSILSSLKNSNGFIIDKTGIPANIILSERGWGFNLYLGKLLPIIGPNPNSGLLLNNKIGFLQHKIKIEEKNKLVPQILKPYNKGYDLLSNGLALSQFIGYMHSDNKKLINFYIGLEFREAFTKNRREFNFDILQKDNKQYIDIFIGIKAGWFIPLYKKNHEESYYF